MNINEYIEKVHNNKEDWFVDEVNHQIDRQRKVLRYKDYLNGQHKILQKPDIIHRGKLYKTKKLVLQSLETILRFNVAYLVGNPVNLKGTDTMIKKYTDVYRKGNYNSIDYKAVDDVINFGDAYEHIQIDTKPITNKRFIKSRLIRPEDGFPVYSESMDYVAFIEHWITNNVFYYYVYYLNRVEYWNNDGGDLHLIEVKPNVSGLPIHWHNDSKYDDLHGKSMLDKLIPLMDTLEDFLSKMDDSLYTNSLNPIISQSGVCLEPNGTDQTSADGYGHIVYLDDNASLDIHSTTLDSATIKLYLDQIKQQLIDIGCTPSVSYGQGNIANISQEVIEVIYQNADNLAKENSQWVLECMKKRLEIIEGLLINNFKEFFTDDDYIDVQLNYNRIINNKELIENLLELDGQEILSKDDVREQVPYIRDIEQTKKRIAEQKQNESKNKDNNSALNNDNKNDNNKGNNV